MGRLNVTGSCAPLICPSSGVPWSGLTYGYDFLGDVTSLYDSDANNTLTYHRNSIGQLQSVTSSLSTTALPGTLISGVQYNALGEPTLSTTADGYARTDSYDKMGRTTGYTLYNGTSQLYGLQLGYDSAGNLNTAGDWLLGVWTYAYDPSFFHRLDAATCDSQCFGGWGTLSWTYDEYGNRWAQSASYGPNTSYSFNANNQITTGGVHYDAAGNITTDGLGNTLSYDAEGRLSGDGVRLFTYDAFGNRVETRDSSTTTDFVYSGTTLQHRNTYNPSTHTGSNGWGMESGFGEYGMDGNYYTTYRDQVGSFRLQYKYASSGSTMVAACAGLPFGDGLTCEAGGNAIDNFFFAGMYLDPNGQDHTLARQYSPNQGRWTAPDPAGLAAVDPSNPQSWNRYAYVLNNPLSFVDPLGLCGSGQPGDPPCPAPPQSVTVNGDAPQDVPTQTFINIILDFCQFDVMCSASGPGPRGNHIWQQIRSHLHWPKMRFGVRAAGQTWSQCMSANANTYSIGGSIELVGDVAFNKNTSISSNPLISAVTGNSINTFFFGSTADAAAGMGANTPGLVSTAMGSATSYGRRTSDIMSLNLAGTPGGPAVALSQASDGVKTALGEAGDALSLGMSFARRTAFDTGFTAAEAINCAISQ